MLTEHALESKESDDLKQHASPLVAAPDFARPSSPAQRSPGNLAVQRRAQSAADTTPAAGAPSVLHHGLRSPGQPLDHPPRGFMQSRFGQNFSRVRVHTDKSAAESAHAINAVAYTVGRDVVFGSGRYDPRSPEGQHLLA